MELYFVDYALDHGHSHVQPRSDVKMRPAQLDLATAAPTIDLPKPIDCFSFAA